MARAPPPRSARCAVHRHVHDRAERGAVAGRPAGGAGASRLSDAPVTGSRPRAEDGTLTVMVGGESADVARARPLLEAMGELIVHVGPRGHGAMTR